MLLHISLYNKSSCICCVKNQDYNDEFYVGNIKIENFVFFALYFQRNNLDDIFMTKIS